MNLRLSAAAVCLIASLALAQAPRPSATTRPNISFEPELRDALMRLDQHISPDVRANKRPPSERERKLAQLMSILLMSERPENANSGQKSAANMQVADKAIRDQFAKQKADPANAAVDVQAELALLEKLSLESIHLLDFLSRPGSFPTTRESQLDLAKRLDRIPAMLDQEARISRDVAHHERRLAVLKRIGELTVTGQNPNELAASKALLAALDQLAVEQAKVDTLTPLGVAPATQPTTQPVE
jgi:hypothetical protein